MRREGSRITVSTHSPLLASLPGATVLELGEPDIRRAASFDDLLLVQNWRLFLGDPRRLLRHLRGLKFEFRMQKGPRWRTFLSERFQHYFLALYTPPNPMRLASAYPFSPSWCQ
jgi:hypothetical protein